MFQYTEFKVFNIINQDRPKQNRKFYTYRYMTNEEIENWVLYYFGNKKWKLIKRTEIVESTEGSKQ